VADLQISVELALLEFGRCTIAGFGRQQLHSLVVRLAEAQTENGAGGIRRPFRYLRFDDAFPDGCLGIRNQVVTLSLIA
jgi:hypothetical protein